MYTSTTSASTTAVRARTSQSRARSAMSGRKASAGSRGDHSVLWKNNSNHNNNSNHHDHEQHPPYHYYDYDYYYDYYYPRSAEDAATTEISVTSSNDDHDDLSTTALQGHHHYHHHNHNHNQQQQQRHRPRTSTMATNIVSTQTLARSRTVSSSSSSGGTVPLSLHRPSTVRVRTPDISNITNTTNTNTNANANTPSLLARRGAPTKLNDLLNVSGDTARYLDLSDASAPPVSAPPVQNVFSIPNHLYSNHHRSASDLQPKQQHKRGRSSRDIGIVGTIPTISTNLNQMAPGSQLHLQPSPADPSPPPSHPGRLTLPLFQTPRSRSPSPSGALASMTPVTDTETEKRTMLDQDDSNNNNDDLEDTPTKPVANRAKHASSSVDTPRTSIERERDKQKHTTRLAYKPAQPLSQSYLYYQPGLHSTAGPLPSPPRRIYSLAASNAAPPPRPPRLTPTSRPASSERERPQSQLITTNPEAMSSQVQLTNTPSTSSDYSLTAVSVFTSDSEKIVSREGSTPPESDEQATPSRSASRSEITNTDGHAEQSHHTREGAFGISTVGLEQPSKQESKIIQEDHGPFAEDKAEALSITSSSNQQPDPIHIQSESPESARVLTSDLLVISPPSSPSSYGSSIEPQVPKLPPALQERRASIRISPPLSPLTPEPIIDTFYQPTIMSNHITVDLSNQLSSANFYPKKTPSDWPDAMNFKDILSMKSSKERALAYNARFRELMHEETGLRHWVACVAKKDRNERNNLTVPSTTPVMNQLFQKQTRHVSRGSIASEATFPIRGDAYTATDLMTKPADMPPSSMTAPPSLPYPSLAQGIGIRRRGSKNFSVDSPFLVSPTHSSRSLGGGFFASIGRKASLRKDRAIPQPVSPTKQSHSLLHPTTALQQQQQQQQQQLQQQQNSQRVIKLEHAPTLPGGPRAPPRSAHRSSTLIYSRKIEDSSSSVLSKRHSISPGRRSVDSTSNSSLDRRIEMMGDHLPNVEKPVLSAYLRRAQNNDPMTAINDYLKDANNEVQA